MSGDGTQGSQNQHIPYAVVPLLAIIGAAAFVMLAYVFYRHMSAAADEPREMTNEQAIYMREVRHRNREDIEALTGHYKSHRQSRGWWSEKT